MWQAQTETATPTQTSSKDTKTRKEMRTVRILTVLNGVGLQRDTAIVADLFKQAGWEVVITDIKRELDKRHFDLNVHLEILSKEHIHRAFENWLIPNPEWFFKGWADKLKFVSNVICKTKDCQRIFQGLGCNTVYTSFTSEDRYEPVTKQRIFFHNQGKSDAKNTDVVLNCWRQYNPGVSCVLVGKNRGAPIKDVIRCGYMGENEFKTLQNTCLFHVCPSQYEGFGHYIWEALSCGNIVLTTNAAPMSEFIDTDCGILIDTDGTSHPQHYGSMWHVQPSAIKKAIDYAVNLPEDKVREMSKAARQRFLDNDAFFKAQFSSLI